MGDVRWAVAVSAFVALACAPMLGSAEPPPCAIVPESLKAAESIRGLRAIKPVPCLVHGEAEVRNHLLELIDTKMPPKKMAAEERLYKALGFLPESFDYKDGIVDLYVSQLGGYYDPEKKHFVMASWMPMFVQGPIVVHELTHALQDQAFDLEQFIRNDIDSSDVLLARSAIAEGDATAVMIDQTRRVMGQRALATEPNVDLIIAQNVIGMAMMPGLSAVPESLKSMLIFPYTSGLRFVHARLQSGGYRAVDEAFRSPPRSTEEILHPELYGAKVPSFEVLTDGDAVPLVPGGGAVEYGDAVGEFLTGATLVALGVEKLKAVAAAAGWGGDRATLVAQRGTGKLFLVWRSSWDTAADAAEFCRAYRHGLAQMNRNAEVQCDEGGRSVVILRDLGTDPSPEKR